MVQVMWQQNFGSTVSFFPLIGLPGVVANLASFIVFSQKNMRSSINIYLAGLSLFDCAVLFFACLIYPLKGYCYKGSLLACNLFPPVSLVCFPLSLIAYFGSVWSCVAIAIDRFLAVRWPLKVRLWCTRKRARRILLIIFTSAILFNIPAFFEFTLKDGSLHPHIRTNSFYVTVYKRYEIGLFRHWWASLFYLVGSLWSVFCWCLGVSWYSSTV